MSRKEGRKERKVERTTAKKTGLMPLQNRADQWWGKQ
jgi:hypothetical protein